MAVEHQVIVIYAGVNGYLDKVDVKRIGELEAALIPFVQSSHPDIFATIKKENKISPELEAKIKSALRDFLKTF